MSACDWLFGFLFLRWASCDAHHFRSVRDSAILLSLLWYKWKMKVGWRMCVAVQLSLFIPPSLVRCIEYCNEILFLSQCTWWFFILYEKNLWYERYKLRNDEATLYRLSQLQLHLILIERFTSTSRHFLSVCVCVRTQNFSFSRLSRINAGFVSFDASPLP